MIDVSLLESLLEEGLFLFGAKKTEAAIAVWRKALELAPGDPRVIDFLESAGGLPAGLATGTHPGRGPTPLAVQRYAESKRADVERTVVPPQPFDGFRMPATSVRASNEQPVVQAPSGTYAPPTHIAAPSLGYGPMPKNRWPLFLGLAGASVLVVGGLLAYAALSKNDTRSNETTTPAAAPQQVAAPGSEARTPTPSENLAGNPAQPGYFRVEVQATPASATVSIDEELLANGQLVARFPLDGKPHTLRVEADGYTPIEVTFVDAAPAKEFVLSPIDAKEKSARKKRTRTRKSARTRKPARDKRAAPKKESASKQAAPPAPVRPLTDNLDPWAK